MMAGASFYFEPGIKSISMFTDKYHTGKNLADGVIWKRADTTYRNLGLMFANTQYSTHIRFNIEKQFPDFNTEDFYYIRVKFYFRAKEWNGAGLKYAKLSFDISNYGDAHYVLTYPTAAQQTLIEDASETAIVVVMRYAPPMDYAFNFIMPEFTEDRDMQFRAEFIEFLDVNLETVTPVFGHVATDFDYKIYHEFGFFPILKSDVVKFIAVADTTEVETKELKILAPETYGSQLSKAVIWDGNVSTPSERSDLNWRLATGDSFEGLERAILRNLLKQMGSKQKYLTGTLNVKTDIPGPFFVLNYRADDYKLSGIKWNIYKCLMDVTAIRIPTNAPDITVNLTEPLQTIYAQEFKHYEDVLLSTGGSSITIFQQEFEGVTDSFVNLDLIPFSEGFLADFAASDTVEGVKTKWQVYKNGVKQRYVDWGTSPTLLPHEWTFDIAGNNIEFGYDLDSDLVEVIYYQI